MDFRESGSSRVADVNRKASRASSKPSLFVCFSVTYRMMKKKNREARMKDFLAVYKLLNMVNCLFIENNLRCILEKMVGSVPCRENSLHKKQTSWGPEHGDD